MSKILKIFITILIFILVYCIINISPSSKVLAISTDYIEESSTIQISSTTLYEKDALSEFTQGIDNYKVDGENNDDVVNIINTVLGIITVVGAVIAVITVAMIGFYAILGSSEDKALNKEQLVTWFIGAVIMASGSAIVKMIFGAVFNW